MSLEITGDLLERLKPTVKTALGYYQRISNGLGFDAEKASKLSVTSDKPNSARSETDVFFRGEPVDGKLYVIAFKPGDGTGSEINYRLQSLDVDSPYPRDVRVVPRNKVGIHSEVHLTLTSYNLEDLYAEPKIYDGRFDLLGLDGNKVRKIGELGNPADREVAIPVRTFTVGYREGRKFGDPHAVLSTSKVIQVCAFLAVTNEVYKSHPDIWDGLSPRFPN